MLYRRKGNKYAIHNIVLTEITVIDIETKSPQPTRGVSSSNAER